MFSAHVVFVETLQFCSYSSEATTDNPRTYERVSIPVNLCLCKQAAGWIWPGATLYLHTQKSSPPEARDAFRETGVVAGPIVNKISIVTGFLHYVKLVE